MKKQTESPVEPPAKTISKAPTEATALTVLASGISSKIQPVKSLGNPPIKILIYGRSGVGKTTIAATFPKPTLLLDVKEHGTGSISDVKELDVLPVTEWSEIEEIFWYLYSGKHKYKTVVIDTVTQMQDLAVIYCKEQEGKKRDDATSKNMWGQAAALMKATLINFRDLPLDVIFLAQDRVSTEDTSLEDQIITEVGPRLMPSVAGTINAAVSVIGQAYIKEYTTNKDGQMKTVFSYRLRIGPHAYYLTKVRKEKAIVVPESIGNPTYEKLLSYLNKPQITEVK